MNTLRYLLFGALLVLVSLGLWVVVREPSGEVAQAQVQAQALDGMGAPCNCQSKLAIPQDPEERMAFDQACAKTLDAAQTDRLERNQLDRKKWVGCKFTPAATAKDQAALELQQRVAELLSARQPAPKEREAEYQWALDYPGCQLVGWDILVSHVNGTADGQTIELLVQPRLVRDGVGITTVTQTCKETWKLGLDGKLMFQGIQPAGGLKLLTGD